MQDSPQPMKAANINHASRAWPGGTQRRGRVGIRAGGGKLLIGNDGDRFTTVIFAGKNATEQKKDSGSN